MVVATRITEEVDEEFGSWIASQTAAPTFDSSGQYRGPRYRLPANAPAAVLNQFLPGGFLP